MTKKIPQIKFEPKTQIQAGIELIPISKIKLDKENFLHNPEQPHQLSFYNIIYFIQGKGKHFIDFKWYDISKNSIVYLSKGQINAFDFSSNLEGFCIVFTEEYFMQCFANLPQHFTYRFFNPQLFSPILTINKNANFKTYFELLKTEYQNLDNEHQTRIIDALLSILIAKAEQIGRQQSKTKNVAKIQLFQEFNSLLEIHFTKQRKALFYAQKLAISYKHLNTLCKNLVNKTAKKVIDDFVILQAKRNLINVNMQSAELAYKLGFEDPTNFSKFFKKKTGVSPKTFQKQYIK